MKKLVLFFLLKLCSSVSVLACSCGYVGIFESMESSDVIFKGRAVDIEPLGDDNVVSTYKITFSISSIYKYGFHLDETQISIYTRSTSSSCGYLFEMNEDYLVYAKSNGVRLSTNLCTRTKSFGFIAFVETLFLTKWIYVFPPFILGGIFFIWRFIKKASSEK